MAFVLLVKILIARSDRLIIIASMDFIPERFSVMTMLKKSLNWRVAGAVFALAMTVGSFNLGVRSAASDCLENCVNNVLDEAEQVSWVSWLTGRSTSYRFHFLDLLELLSRHKGKDSE